MMKKSPKKWYNLFLLLCLVFLAYTLLLAPHLSPVYGQEPQYDLNKIRLKIFHLLNFTAADNTLITPPGGKKITPTPKTPGPPGGSATILTRIFCSDGTTETTIGAGTYTPSSGYRLQLTKQIPLKNKSSAANKYYLWLVKTSLTPPAAEQITTFDTAFMPSMDKTYPKNLSDYNEVVVTEEDPSKNPTAPNLSSPIFTCVQAPIAVTPTPPAGPTTPPGGGPTAVPTPTSSAGGTGNTLPTPAGGGNAGNSIFDLIKKLFGL